MRLPIQKRSKRTRTSVNAFGGYDRRGDTHEGNFFDMNNMTGDSYPYLQTRKKRGEIQLSGERVFDIFSLDIGYDGKIVKNALIADCENRIKAYFEDNGTVCAHDLFNTTSTLSKKEKCTCVSGTCIYFFPDNVYYNVMDSSVGVLQHSVSYALGIHSDAYYELALEPCGSDGEDSTDTSPYRRFRRSCYKIINGEKGDFISHLSFSRGFKVGDTVKISGLKSLPLNRSYSIVGFSSDYTSLVVEASETLVQSEDTVYISRDVPQMDYVVSAGNRLWGCRYGRDAYGNCVNEIYASALGDPSNWYKFCGASTDSWSASVGVGGAFTGAVCLDGYPVFFKEDAIIKVYGSYPSEFTLKETRQRGIEAGSSKSAVFVDDDLYYKTYSGIVRYDGGMPVNIDAPLGGELYKNAVAGSADGKYYVSMENREGDRVLFVYDKALRLWHKEDTLPIVSFARCGDRLYCLANDSRILSLSEQQGLISEESVEWMCESVRLGYELPDRKYVAALTLRLRAEEGACVTVETEYDSNGIWHRSARVAGDGKARLIWLRPRRCDHFRLRLSGVGNCTLCYMTKELEACSAYGK